MNELPAELANFVTRHGWRSADVSPLPGDASFRRYFRVCDGQRSAMVMHAPAPHEDPEPFLKAAYWLCSHGLRAPLIHAHDQANGFVLMEDFGDDRLREHLEYAQDEEAAAYRAAIDTLVELQQLPPGPFDPYSMDVYLREVALFTEWYCPAMQLAVDAPGWLNAWQRTLDPLMPRQAAGVTVLRDYHAENIMLPADGAQGLIDFQDALVGHRAYDLVSLLQDARRDVSRELEGHMLRYFREKTHCGPSFGADYARLGAQRNAKIVGIFARLAKRDGKQRYLSMIPRVWRMLERDLSHDALAPVRAWFDMNIPRDIRVADGGALS